MGFRGGVTFWSVSVSIVLHLVVCGLFVITRFSGARSEAADIVTVSGSIREVRRLLEEPGVMAKPKVKRSRPAIVQDDQLVPESIFSPARSEFEDKPELLALSKTTTILSAESDFSLKSVEFFGSKTSERKICYVVDCSGSMKGLFRRVRKNLKASIASLEPDQYFCIIFFGSGKLFEYSNGTLIRATARSKAAAYRFADEVKPAGRGDAMLALERAMLMRDNGGMGAGLVYFLSDGFELINQRRRIAGLFKGSGAEVKINTIGFWPQREDRMVLESIAKRSGGDFKLINDN